MAYEYRLLHIDLWGCGLMATDITIRNGKVYLFSDDFHWLTKTSTNATAGTIDDHERYKTIYSKLPFEQLLYRYQNIHRITSHDIRTATKNKSEIPLIEAHIQNELKWIPIIATEKAFPQDPDFFFCHDIIQPLIDACNLAKTDLPILLLGGSGTGKESFASLVHRNSNKWNHAYKTAFLVGFDSLHCHSSLFGHVKGAFTGAARDRVGLVEMCENGTIFFDEIDKLPLEVQSKLLRFLETHEYTRLGEDIPRHANCRCVFASSRNIPDLVKKDLFLADLYFRISGAIIHIPSFKDIILSEKNQAAKLFFYFFSRYSKSFGFETGTRLNDVWSFIKSQTHQLKLWMQYDWPGNFREFKYYVQKNLVLNRWGDLPIDSEDSAPSDAGQRPQAEKGQFPRFDEYERQYIQQLLLCSNGSIKQASEISGLSISTIQRKIKALGIAR